MFSRWDHLQDGRKLGAHEHAWLDQEPDATQGAESYVRWPAPRYVYSNFILNSPSFTDGQRPSVALVGSVSSNETQDPKSEPQPDSRTGVLNSANYPSQPTWRSQAS